MKLKELIESLDRTNTKLEDIPDWEYISNDLGTYLNWSDDTRLKSYWLQTWYCTDTYVGIKAYYLDDELVCVSIQNGRKSSPNFEWVSKEIALKVKLYLFDLVEVDTNTSVTILDLNEEMGNGFKIEYGSQLLPQFHKKGIIRDTGEEVTIEETWNDYTSFHEVIVKVGDSGYKKLMDVREIEFKYATTFEDAKIKYNRNYNGFP